MKKITLFLTMLLFFALEARSQFPAPYCAAAFSNGVEPITLVQFAGIDNASAADLGGSPHENFLNFSGTVAPGITYPITLKGNTGGGWTNYFKVFIDWNQDNDFADAGESYEIGTIFGSTGTDAVQATGNIIPPATATLGSTRMRVTKRFSTYSDPCNSIGTGYGQVEDYTLNVVAPTCTPPTVTFAKASLCPTASFNVTVNLTAMGSSSSYVVTDNQQSPSQNISAAGTLTFGPYPSGTDIQITVTDPNASLCNTTSAVLTDVCAPGCASNPSPANGAVDVPSGAITLEWDVPTTGGTPVEYDLYSGNAPGDLGYTGTYATNTSGDDLTINAYGVTIYWQVIAINAAGEAVGCAEWSFVVEDSPGYCLISPAGLFPAATFTPATCDGVTENIIVENAYAGEYSNVNVTNGQTYIFKSGSADFITIGNTDGSVAIVYGATPLTWVSDQTGVVRFYSHVDDQCGSENVNRTRSIICGTPAPDAPDFANLQWPPTQTITEGGAFDVFGQVFEPGVTEAAGQGAGITAWIGISTTNSNPNTWNNWTQMTFNPDATNPGNNDEYMANIGDDLEPGTYYYATRYRLNQGGYVYGGIDGTNGGNFWNGTQYISGVLTVTPPPAPANDDCAGAVALTVDAAFCNGTTTNGTNLGATDSGVEAAECFNYGENDVWFSFVAPSDTATVDVSTDFLGGTLYDTEIALYSGTCGSLTEIACSQDDGTTVLPNEASYNSLITDAEVTAGATYYVRVSGYSDDDTGSFCLEVSRNQLSVATSSRNRFTVSPNPVSDVLNISGDLEIASATVRNLLGQQVLFRTMAAGERQINMSALASGTYMVELASENGKQTVKVIKQ